LKVVNKWFSGRRKLAMLGIAAMVLTAFAGLCYRQWKDYRRANLEAERSRKTLAAIDSILAALEEADRGERGYLLTGEDRYLEPYNRALQELPGDLASLENLLSGSQQGRHDAGDLSVLANKKLDELDQTIELRRKQGLTPAIALVLDEQVTRTMGAIRALCAQMRSGETATQARASSEGEAAAGTAILITVAGSLVLLFFFAFGFEPFASPDPQAWRRPWLLRYGAAVLAVVAITLLRAALTPLIGPTNFPFTLFFCAVIFAAWFGGFRTAVLAIVLSLLAGCWFFAAPTRSLRVGGRDDQVAMLMIVLVGFGTGLLSRSQRSAVERALRAEHTERNERQRFETTLASIGDAVIATDGDGHVTFANKAALSLMRCAESEIAGKPLDEVFRIVNEITRAAVESPVARVLREGAVVGLANHTVLIARDGAEVPIDDSAAPLYDANGEIMGAVLIFRDISERRSREKALEAQSLELRQRTHLLEHIHCFVRAMDDTIDYWNPGAADLYGFSAKEAVGVVSHILLKTVFPAPLRQILAHLHAAGRWDGELIHTRQDGDRVTVASHWALHRDPNGVPISILEVNVDITGRKRAEQQLAEQALQLERSAAEARAQRERLSGIIDSAMDAIITVDRSQRIKLFNRAAEAVFRCSASEALDQSLDGFVPERYRRAHRQHIEKFGEAGTTSRSMYRPGVLWGVRKNGEEFPLEASISQVESDGERLFTVILRDITERKRIEDDLYRERERLGLALTAGNMGVFEVDPLSGALWWSSETYSLFGVNPTEFKPARDSFAALIRPQDRESFMQYWEENIAGYQPINHEFRISMPGGKERWISCRGFPKYDDSGSPIHYSGLFLDITERKGAEQVMRQFEKLSAAARLSAAIAHEINNPLGAVTNLIYLAKEAPGVPGSIVKQLALAEQELERVAHATRQALGFYRESSRAERIDIPELIESVLKVFSNKITEKKIRIVRGFFRCPPVYGVRGEIRQVISNLLANAIEAVTEGGTISLGAQPVDIDEKRAIEVIVADDGHGIATEHIERVFEPFFTTKAGTGMGLGLWVAKEIIERHQGKIEVQETDNKSDRRGTTLIVRLPSDAGASVFNPPSVRANQ